MISHCSSSEWTWAVGIVVLLGVLAYAVYKTSHRSAAEKRLTDEGTKKVYREEERAEKEHLR
jgi:hypothetical protein